MYLEISARRSGKTTRLINAAIIADLKGETVYVVTLNVCTAQDFKRMVSKIVPRNSIRFLGATQVTSGVRLGQRPRPEGISWFYDEFDFMSPENVIIKDNGYYATTPIKLRTKEDYARHILDIKYDPMIELLSRNTNGFIKTIWIQ